MKLTDTERRIDEHEYPATTDDLIESCGDWILELQNGTESVGEVLARLGPETFETAEDARFAVYGTVSVKAIGRFGYSDRDPTPPGSPYAPEVLSL